MLRGLIKIVYEERNIYPFFPEKRIIWVGICIMLLGFICTDVQIIGLKTEAMIDVWFLQHVFSGIIMCFITIAFRKVIQYPLLIAVGLAYCWEGVEYALEVKSYETIMFWFAGLEHPLNKWVVDPLAAAIGFILVKRHPWVIYPAIVFALFFLVLHLWLGDSMAIQKLLTL